MSEIKSLLDHCLLIRRTWIEIGAVSDLPAKLRDIWDKMEMIGGNLPPRPSELITTPGLSFFIEAVKEQPPVLHERARHALNEAIAWCEKMIVDDGKSEQNNTEQHMLQMVQAVGDDNAASILTVAHRKDLSGEQKMQEILRIDRTYAAKDSNQWATLLGVSAAAVRGYQTWKFLQPKKTR